MSLKIRVELHGTVLADVEVYRPKETYTANAEDEITYRYDYRGVLGTTSGGKVTHRPIDGATRLAVKTLDKIYEDRIRP